MIFIPGTSVGGDIIIEISMISPPSTDVITGFLAFSAGNNGIIEETAVSLQSTNSGLAIINVQIEDNEVNRTSSYLVNVLCDNPVSEDADLVIQFTDGVSIEEISVFGVFGIVFYCEYQVALQIVDIKSSFSGYLEENSTIIVNLLGVTNPIAASAESITVNIKTSTGGELCKGAAALNFKPHFLDYTITSDSFAINTLSTYNFSIASLYLTPSSSVQITFPKQISIKSAEFISQSATCAFTDSQALLTSLNFSENLDFSIQGIQNSNTTQATDPFTIKVFSDVSLKNLISQNSETTLTCTPGNIIGKVDVNNDVTGVLARYSLQMILENYLGSSGEIQIFFPNEIYLQATSQCVDIQGLPLGTTCVFKNNMLTVKNGFLGQETYNFGVTVTDVKNPNSTCKSSSFIVYSVYQGFTVDALESGLIVNVNTPNQLFVSIDCSDYTVGKTVFYVISITSTNFVTNTLEMTVPSEILMSNPICTGVSSSIISVICTRQGTLLVVNFVFASNTLNSYKFKVDNVQNPKSLKPTETIYFRTISNSCTIDEGNITLTMVVPGALSVSFNTTTSLLNTLADYSFTLQYSTVVPPDAILTLTFSNDFLIPSSTFCSIFCEKAGSSIVTSAVSQFSLFNITNPSTTTLIFLYTSASNYLIDSFQGYLFIPTCEPGCLTCESQNNLCTTCEPNLFLYNFSCISVCPIAYGPINSICTECEISCKSCKDATDYCTDCYSGFVYNGDCVSICPNTSVVTGNSCENCYETCYTCEGSSDHCTSCNNFTSFYLNQCLDKCPVGFYSVLGLCQTCPCTEELLNNGICDSNCDIQACNYDNNDCLTSISVSSLPSISAGAGSVVVSSASKAFPGSSIIGSTQALWGVTQSCSWISMAYTLHKSEARRLIDSKSTLIIFNLFVTLLVVKLALNILFTCIFIFKYAREDRVYFEYMEKNKIAVGVIGSLSAVFSFQLIRITYSGPNCLSFCRAGFQRKTIINTFLIAHSISGFVLVIAPVIALLSYVLVLYYNDHQVFLQAADCLGLSILVALTSIFDLVQLSLQVGKESPVVKGNVIVPIEGTRERFADETYETKFEEGFTERRLKEAERSDFFEPEIEEAFMDMKQPVMRIGGLLENIDEIDLESLEEDEYDHSLAVVLHKASGLHLLLKPNSESLINSKIIDIQHPVKGWRLGRTIDLADLKLVGPLENSNSAFVKAFHISSGYTLVISQTFVGSYLSDLATGTVFSKILTDEQALIVVPDTDDLHYGTVRINNYEYRVRRTFKKPFIVDVLNPAKNNFEVSFDGDFGIIDNITRNEDFQEDSKEKLDKTELESKDNEESNRETLFPVEKETFNVADSQENLDNA